MRIVRIPRDRNFKEIEKIILFGGCELIFDSANLIPNDFFVEN